MNPLDVNTDVLATPLIITRVWQLVTVVHAQPMRAATVAPLPPLLNAAVIAAGTGQKPPMEAYPSGYTLRLALDAVLHAAVDMVHEEPEVSNRALIPINAKNASHRTGTKFCPPPRFYSSSTLIALVQLPSPRVGPRPLYRFLRIISR